MKLARWLALTTLPPLLACSGEGSRTGTDVSPNATLEQLRAACTAERYPAPEQGVLNPFVGSNADAVIARSAFCITPDPQATWLVGTPQRSATLALCPTVWQREGRTGRLFAQVYGVASGCGPSRAAPCDFNSPSWRANAESAVEAAVTATGAAGIWMDELDCYHLGWSSSERHRQCIAALSGIVGWAHDRGYLVAANAAVDFAAYSADTSTPDRQRLDYAAFEVTLATPNRVPTADSVVNVAANFLEQVRVRPGGKRGLILHAPFEGNQALALAAAIGFDRVNFIITGPHPDAAGSCHTVVCQPGDPMGANMCRSHGASCSAPASLDQCYPCWGEARIPLQTSSLTCTRPCASSLLGSGGRYYANCGDTADIFFNDSDTLWSRTPTLAIPAHSGGVYGPVPLDAGQPQDVLADVVDAGPLDVPGDAATAFDVGEDAAVDVSILSDRPDAARPADVETADAGACDGPDGCVCGPGTTYCGSCVDTMSNAAHCGACGVACSTRPNATGTCRAGTCGIACLPGFGDCNGNPADGCERALNTDAACGSCTVSCTAGTRCTGATCAPICTAGTTFCVGSGACTALDADTANCGSCGRSCVAPTNATSSCARGACGYTCLSGFADCDGNASNGCEVDLRSNAANCGACGRGCSFANAGASCAASTCVIGTCGSAYRDCDGNASNGCEASIDTNTNCGGCGTSCTGGTHCAARACVSSCPGLTYCSTIGRCTNTTADSSNCGGCDRACAARPNARASCMASACAYACDAGRGDCDGASANGCETDTGTSVAHCGACGRPCAAGSICAAGSCVAGSRRLRLELTAAAQLECPGGWFLEYYSGADGSTVRAPTRGTPFETILPADWAYRGTLAFNAWCPTLVNGSNWRTWTSWANRPAIAAAVASIALDGVELADSEAWVCNYFPSCPYGQASYWTSPRVPLDASFAGRCDVSATMCPSWCATSSCR